MTDMEFAAVCETALAGTKLSGSVVAAREDGEFALARDEYDAWRVTEMILYASANGESYRAALHLHEDCLADDIYLATCEPGDWRRGEREEDYYGW